MTRGRLSLRYKLTALYAVSLLSLMVIAAWSTRRVARSNALADVRQQLHAALQDTARALGREFHRRGYLTQDNALEVMRQSLSGLPWLTNAELTWYDGGRPLGVTLHITQYRYVRTREGVKALRAPHVIQAQKHMLLDNGVSARITLEADAAEVDRLVNRLSHVFLNVSAIGLLVLFVVTWLIVERLIAGPLAQLTGLTREVAEGRLEVHPPKRLLRRRDEIGLLAATFQDMVEALARSEEQNRALVHELQVLNRNLEDRIAAASSALKTQTDALIQAREDLARQERLAALGQLAGNIAHEIGTPLGTLSGYLQLMRADPALPKTLVEPLDVAGQEVMRMTQIIRRFLDSTRGLRPAPEPCDLQSLIREVIRFCIELGTQNRIETHVDVDEAVRFILCDPGLLRQVLTNLIRNAADAMDHRGRIEIRARGEDKWLIIDVIDDGPGIPKENRKRIFEPFYTTKSIGQGTGLGLAISREIARALGGELCVVDEEPDEGRGSGACFRLKIPFRKADDNEGRDDGAVYP